MGNDLSKLGVSSVDSWDKQPFASKIKYSKGKFDDNPCTVMQIDTNNLEADERNAFLREYGILESHNFEKVVFKLFSKQTNYVLVLKKFDKFNRMLLVVDDMILLSFYDIFSSLRAYSELFEPYLSSDSVGVNMDGTVVVVPLFKTLSIMGGVRRGSSSWKECVVQFYKRNFSNMDAEFDRFLDVFMRSSFSTIEELERFPLFAKNEFLQFVILYRQFMAGNVHPELIQELNDVFMSSIFASFPDTYVINAIFKPLVDKIVNDSSLSVKIKVKICEWVLYCIPKLMIVDFKPEVSSFFMYIIENAVELLVVLSKFEVNYFPNIIKCFSDSQLNKIVFPELVKKPLEAALKNNDLIATALLKIITLIFPKLKKDNKSYVVTTVFGALCDRSSVVIRLNTLVSFKKLIDNIDPQLTQDFICLKLPKIIESTGNNKIRALCSTLMFQKFAEMPLVLLSEIVIPSFSKLLLDQNQQLRSTVSRRMMQVVSFVDNELKAVTPLQDKKYSEKLLKYFKPDPKNEFIQRFALNPSTMLIFTLSADDRIAVLYELDQFDPSTLEVEEPKVEQQPAAALKPTTNKKPLVRSNNVGKTRSKVVVDKAERSVKTTPKHTPVAPIKKDTPLMNSATSSPARATRLEKKKNKFSSIFANLDEEFNLSDEDEPIIVVEEAPARKKERDALFGGLKPARSSRRRKKGLGSKTSF
ncbi:hypothetical protein PCE1_003477 [Barthelona sp. PCE]